MFLWLTKDSGEKQRLWVIDQLTSLCRNKALPKDDVWVWHILEFLLVFGFFEVKRRDKKSKVPAVSWSDSVQKGLVLTLSLAPREPHLICVQ